MRSGWLEVDGVVVRGHGVASGVGSTNPYPGGSLAAQIPLFAALGLDLGDQHRGTINIDIAPKRFESVRPAYTFERIVWTNRIPPETFSFFHCEIGHGGSVAPGWVYRPHPETKVEHLQDPHVIEVITVFLPSVRAGNHLHVAVPEDEACFVTE